MGDVITIRGATVPDPAPRARERQEPPGPRHRPDGPEPLWREEVGRQLRRARQEAGLRLVDVAARSGVSPQYLSEVERGLKDVSSELFAAIAGALDLRVREVVSRVVFTGVPAPAPAPGRSGPASGPLCLAA